MNSLIFLIAIAIVTQVRLAGRIVKFLPFFDVTTIIHVNNNDIAVGMSSAPAPSDEAL